MSGGGGQDGGSGELRRWRRRSGGGERWRHEATEEVGGLGLGRGAGFGEFFPQVPRQTLYSTHTSDERD